MTKDDIPASVLIVDDNPAKLSALEAALDGMGIEIVTATSGTEALHKLLTQDFAAVLLDVNMPIMDGFETAEMIRRRPRSEHLPILFITAERLTDDARMKGYELGAVDYILSPVLPQILCSKVEVFANLYRLREKIARQNLLLQEQVEAYGTELRESEARYRRITEGITDYLYTVRIENGRAVETTHNPACVTVTGYTAEEFAAGPHLWIQMVAPDDRERVRKHVQHILTGNDIPPIEHRITKKNGEIRWVSDTTILFRDAAGKLLSYDGVIKDITERKRAEEAQRASALKYQLLFESSRDALMMLAPPSWKFTGANQATLQLFGASSVDEFTALGPWDLSPERQPDGRPSSEKAQEMIATAMREGSNFFEWEHRRLDGEPFAADVLLTCMEVNGDVFLQATVRDISERKRAEDAQRASALKYQLLFESSRDALMMLAPPSWKFTGANQATLQLFGASSVDEFTALGPWDLSPERQPDGRPSSEKAQEMIATAMREGSNFFEWEHQRLGGQPFAADVLLTCMEVGGDVFLQATVRDISERKRAEQIRQLAFYDPLTQLPNRRLLNDRLEQTMAASKRSGRYAALMFLDMDNFKPLNDTYGHDVGDLLLIEVAQRLTRCVREMDTVARFGGDEFLVMLGELDMDKAESATQAGIVAEKIRAALAKPYMLKLERERKTETTVEYRCTSSIGVVLFINHAASTEEIIKWADMAMYQAKKAGRNSIRFYDLKV